MNKLHRSLLAGSLMLAAVPAIAQDQTQSQLPGAPEGQRIPGQSTTHVLPEGFITATGRYEPVNRIAGTVQIIHQDRIEKSTARSVGELLAENSVGFLSEWTPGQTSINIRGAATDGQGRDFRSQVLVLINGHRAGTANVSKLSNADIQRIEIVRGPSSVVYGSQNMGGIINIILKNGRTAPGGFVEGAVGSWDLFEGQAQYGGVTKGFDYYGGVASSTRGNYGLPGGKIEENTAWTRFSGTGAFGYQIDENNRIDATARTDGIYDAGFRGSSANLFAFDTRTNQSFDFSVSGNTPDKKASYFFQAYYAIDVDDLNNPSPYSGLNSIPNRTNIDHNRRQLDVVGTRFQPNFNVWTGNQVMVGVDWEKSWVRSDRNRSGGRSVAPSAPQDNNQTENVFAFYAEDSQSFLDNRVVVRGGVRQTFGTTALDWTPYSPTLITGSTNYQVTTWTAGGTFQATDWLGFRAGASTGFRAPTATEFGANFTVTPIGTTIFGNPGLVAETAQQMEAGATFTWAGGRFDSVIFQNVITNRITPVTISNVGGRLVQQYQNNPANIVVQGLEFQADADLVKSLPLPIDETWNWKLFGNGYYNFKMTDYGAVAAAGTDQAVRINQYGLNVGTQFGQTGTMVPWNFYLLGILRGPMWYNTEESLSPVFFPGQVRSTTVYQKDPFWVWKARGEVELHRGVKLFAAVNNILNVNQHPIFIALDQTQCVANRANQNGGCGNSIPGRELIVGFEVRF
jgi:vitamin B12 transporter